LKTRVRDSQRTRKRILIAAAREFAKRGFDGARISEIARRARTSKQLIHHHFHGKEALFMQVHEAQFRPTVQWKETLPPHAADVIAARFRKRAANMDYLRFLTWEAASAGNTPVPGETERRQRLTEYADAIRAMQAARLMPADFDPRLTQLLILRSPAIHSRLRKSRGWSPAARRRIQSSSANGQVSCGRWAPDYLRRPPGRSEGLVLRDL
jgi:AcrR family transcriptional regulator